MTGIISIHHPGQVGGLPAYQRHLAAALASSGHAGWMSYVSDDGKTGAGEIVWPVSKVRPLLSWRLLRGVFCRFASRPGCHGMLDKLIARSCPEASFRAPATATQVVHFVGTGWDFIGFAACRLARRRGARFTVWPAVHPHDWGDDRIDIQLYKQADAVFCQSDHEKGHLASRGVPEGKLIRCGLPPMCHADGNASQLRTLLEIGQRPAVFFMGRRDAGKGYPALLEAWPLVLRECPQAVLMLAGPGDADEPRLSSIPTANLRDLGCPNEQQKADAYAACDVFCLPSAHESFGIVYVEAWSYGKPVLCGTAPASRELVEHGVTGVWAGQQPQLLASSLLRLLLDPQHRRQLGDAGLRHQRSNYTAERMLGCHMQTWGVTALN